MMEAMGRLPHLLPTAVMVEVGVIKIPTTGAEDVELGEGVDEVVVMEVVEVVVAMRWTRSWWWRWQRWWFWRRKR